MAQTKRLTTAFVRNVKEPGVYPDGDRLYLQVTAGSQRQHRPTTKRIVNRATFRRGLLIGFMSADTRR
jgi:hypothetical protein